MKNLNGKGQNNVNQSYHSNFASKIFWNKNVKAGNRFHMDFITIN